METETVDITNVIEDLEEKINKVSHYCAMLLNKINDLYIRLDITSGVIEEVAFSLGLSQDKYIELVQKRVKETKEKMEQSPLFNS